MEWILENLLSPLEGTLVSPKIISLRWLLGYQEYTEYGGVNVQIKERATMPVL